MGVVAKIVDMQELAPFRRFDVEISHESQPAGIWPSLTVPCGNNRLEAGWINIKMQGQVRMRISATWIEPESLLLRANGTLFVDRPLPEEETAHLTVLPTSRPPPAVTAFMC